MKTFAKRVIFALAPVVLLFLTGEAAARVKLYLQHGKDTYYLFMPISRGNHAPEAPAEYKLHVTPHAGGPKARGAGGAPARASGAEGLESADAATTGLDPNSDTYYYKMAPGIYDAPPPYGAKGIKYRVNSLGFRGPDFDPAAKPSGVTRVFCVGESSTFGMESADGETWPARLGFYLEKQKPGAYEVINAGFDGYYSHNVRNLVIQELSNYHPDMLVIYAGLNDLNFENSLETTKTRSLAVKLNGLLYYRWSMLYTLVVEKVSVMMQGNPVPLIGQTDRSKEHFESNMTSLVRWCKSQSVKCVVVREMVNSAPAVFLSDSLTLREAQDSFSSVSRDPSAAEYAQPLTLYRFVELMKSFKALCVTYGVPFIDVRPAMREALQKGEKLMYDYGHLTPMGNDILGREIAAHLDAGSERNAP